MPYVTLQLASDDPHLLGPHQEAPTDVRAIADYVKSWPDRQIASIPVQHVRKGTGRQMMARKAQCMSKKPKAAYGDYLYQRAIARIQYGMTYFTIPHSMLPTELSNASETLVIK